MDIKNTFLNGDMREEIYTIPPPTVSHNPRELYKLKKNKIFLWYETITFSLI